MRIAGLNHAVLYVTDAGRSADFYTGVLGFEVAGTMADGAAVFLRAPGSDNDHDLALFSIGPARPSAAGRGEVGLYHLAWEVPTLADLLEARRRLIEAGALVGESDHGVSKSLYARDPDGLEFEVMWAVPAELVDPGTGPVTRPLDLAAAVARYGARTPGRRRVLP